MVAVAKAGRTMQYRGGVFEIPADVSIRTCTKCGAQWVSTCELLDLGMKAEKARADAKAKETDLGNAEAAGDAPPSDVAPT